MYVNTRTFENFSRILTGRRWIIATIVIERLLILYQQQLVSGDTQQSGGILTFIERDEGW